MWYHREMCAPMQQQLDCLNSWYSSRSKAVIKHSEENSQQNSQEDPSAGDFFKKELQVSSL